MNNKKMEKASATTAATSVSTASVVATRTLASSAPITSTNKVATIKGIPASNPKSHPKTLDIPNAKKTTNASIPLANGTTAASIKGDKKTGALPPSQQFAKNTGISNKTVSDASSRRICNGHDDGTDRSSKEKQKFQPPLQQQNVSPSSSSMSSSTSPSSSSSSSGIQPAQIASICREVAQVREEHISIRKSLSEREGELGKTRVALRNIAQERDLLRNKVSELEHMLKRSPETYSHVAAILSNTNNSLHGGFQTSPTQSLSSAKQSPEEKYAPKVIPQASIEKSKITEMKSSPIFSSPTRNMVIQQQQNQKLSAFPSSETTFTSRPDIVPPPSQPGTMDSPRKCNGNGGNLTKIGSSLGEVGGGSMDETQKISGNGGGKNGDGGAGGNFIPCLPPQPSSPNISNNINSQESHQASHNNKNLQQKQHSMQESNYNVNNMKHTTTKSSFFAALPDKNNKSIYYGHEARASPTPQPSLSLQYLEYHNGNSRNVNGNDMPAMTNSNNNNNHRKSTSGGGGGRGGVGQYVYDYHHQNQRHLSQSGITGLDLMLLGPDCSTKVVEHLVHPVAIESSVREIQHTMVMRGIPLNGDRVREVEIEIDRLNSRIDHLRSQNDVLTLNLEDAKSHADRLTVLLGKYESNNVALQLALRYSDQMSDTFEVLSALLETELAQVVTRIHAAGQLKLICAPPSPTTPSSSANATSSGIVAVTPRAVVTSSGNNNNSNDNSPSEHVPPPPTSSQAEAAAGKNGSNNNIAIINGNNVEKQKDNNDQDNHPEKVEGERQNKLNDNDNAAVITSESAELVMVPVKNRNGSDKIISPTSPSTASTTVQSPSSTKVMHLVEQARRNRLAAEQAARFLLSKFSSASLHSSPYQHGGLVIPPTGSLNNSNGLGVGDSRGSFFVRPTCQSNSTTSINSVTSNLSNMSGEASLSLSSPSVDGDGEEKVGDIAMKHQLQKKQEEQEQTSAPITSGCRGAQDGGGMEVAAISQENIKKGSAAGVGSDISPTTSYTNTFRPPFTPNGNRQENGCTSIITSLLPLLRNAAAQQKNHHTNNGPTSSPEEVSAAIEPSIRHLISTLKAERDAVKQTVMELESESLESLTPSPKPSSPYYGNGHSQNNNNSSSSNATPTAPWSPAEARKLDLETAVLMQELMAMKEERAELRAQLFLIEKEKDSLELRLRSHESQEEAYRARINYLKSEIMDCKSLHSAATTTTMVTTTLDTYQHQNRNRNEIVNTQQQQQHLQKNNGSNRNLETIINNNNNNNQNVNWEREALLKKRIHELAGTLEKVTIGSQIREKQNQEMINELNRANGILMQTLDVAKKKYQNRIKKMEDQVMYISERHASQLKLFGGERVPTVGSKFHA